MLEYEWRGNTVKSFVFLLQIQKLQSSETDISQARNMFALRIGLSSSFIWDQKESLSSPLGLSNCPIVQLSKLCFWGWRYISSVNIWNQTLCADTVTSKTHLINVLFQINSEEQMFQPANELADFYLKVPLTKWKVPLFTKWKVHLLSKWKVPLITKGKFLFSRNESKSSSPIQNELKSLTLQINRKPSHVNNSQNLQVLWNQDFHEYQEKSNQKW